MRNTLAFAMVGTLLLPHPSDAQSTSSNRTLPQSQPDNSRSVGEETGGTPDSLPAGGTGQPASPATPFLSAPMAGDALFTDLKGSPVRSADGENVGEISDVLIGSNGSLNAIIVSIGGIVGLGGKEIAVPADTFKVGSDQTSGNNNEPPAPTSPDGTSSTRGAGHTGGDQSNTAENGAGANGGQPAADGRSAASLQNLVILDATRGEIDAAPEFER
ncbi:PRC-barrel domain-containing protein [Rhizobium sp. SAFR-030]|uniref:PRC-barrel domain-containing protein n=1 Tax=Rhizobium sp. SAFR-030 TaxID=3387277 RepID=UPI003F7FFAEE